MKLKWRATFVCSSSTLASLLCLFLSAIVYKPRERISCSEQSKPSFQCEWKLDRPSKMVYFLSLNEQELQKYFTDVKRTELWDNLELEDIVSIVINREKWRKQMTVCWLDRRAAPPLDPETVLVRENRKRIHLRQIPAEEYDG